VECHFVETRRGMLFFRAAGASAFGGGGAAVSRRAFFFMLPPLQEGPRAEGSAGRGAPPPTP
jgi:hypothetical protein